MSEYLVSLKIAVPARLWGRERDALYEAEKERAAELAAEGKLLRTWRKPCTTDNWMLWDVADATELHEAVASFPLFRYFHDVQVEELAYNETDPGHGRVALDLPLKLAGPDGVPVDVDPSPAAPGPAWKFPAEAPAGAGNDGVGVYQTITGGTVTVISATM